MKRAVKHGLGGLRPTQPRVSGLRSLHPASPAKRALDWIRAHESPTGGIRVHSDRTEAYPEVTGYVVPTLLQYGERELATRLVRWLVSIQAADGSYPDPDEGVPHVFDTGQILRGLLAGTDLVPEAMEAARRAADYLCGEMLEAGTRGFGARYLRVIPDGVHLYVLPPLYRVAEVHHEARYRSAAQQCLEYYCAQKDALQIDTLTHFIGYELEALIDLGRTDHAAAVLENLRRRQAPDGSVRGEGGAQWVCAPGLAQLAICWYKIGQWEPADKALSWLEAHQQPSGGFLGSSGPGAAYFPDVEIPWAAKFYLDAHQLRVTSFFERNAHIFPSFVSKDDGRARAVISSIRPTDRVLEVGCGKGRFLKAVRAVYPDTECTGVDISPAMLADIPAGFRSLRGPMEALPCSDDSFDVVFSVEAVEHSANMDAAVGEMIRVARPGGRVVVIDKQQAHWGRLDCPSWEEWPEASAMARLLRRGCDDVTVQSVSYDAASQADGLMVVWQGRKRSPLSGAQWNDLLLPTGSQEALLGRIRSHQLSEWGQVILLATANDQRVLEIGSGTGEISLHLARAGRRVTVLDLSVDSLEFTRSCAEKLGVSIETVRADAAGPFDFAEDAFDCTWSSGLLEHFAPEERRAMLRAWAHFTADKIIALVPNAACVAYRAGKALQEEGGTWPYGLEIPIHSLREDFEAAGLHVISESSIGTRHALSFLPAEHPLRAALSAWFDSMPPSAMDDCEQGYLLVTIGSKFPRAKG